MGRNFVATRSNRSESGFRKKTISRSIVIGPGAIKFISLTIVAVLAVVYLNESTAGASQAMTVREIQTTKDDLSLKAERLKEEQTRLSALREIDNGTPKPVMEPVTNVKYTGIPATTAQN